MSRGVYTMGEWCEMHHGENWGGIVMIMMLLLVSIIIYYYMNTFITLHQCTFNLLFALFSILIYQLSLDANSAMRITSYRCVFKSIDCTISICL